MLFLFNFFHCLKLLKSLWLLAIALNDALMCQPTRNKFYFVFIKIRSLNMALGLDEKFTRVFRLALKSSRSVLSQN